MNVIRIVPNIASDAFAASRDFYVAMFDLVVSVELDDWYLQLMPESNPTLNIGFIKPGHELVGDLSMASRQPQKAQQAAADLRKIWQRADKTLPELREIAAVPPPSSF